MTVEEANSRLHLQRCPRDRRLDGGLGRRLNFMFDSRELGPAAVYLQPGEERSQAFPSMVLVAMAHHVDNHGAGEDQNGVLSVRDIDAVGVSQRKPALRNLSSRFVAS